MLSEAIWGLSGINLLLSRTSIGLATSQMVTFTHCNLLALLKIMLIRCVLVNRADTVVENPMAANQGREIHAMSHPWRLTRP